MVRRVLSACFGAVLFGILAPVLVVLIAGIPKDLATLFWLGGGGCLVGAVLGAIYPRVFGFVFSLFLDV